MRVEPPWVKRRKRRAAKRREEARIRKCGPVTTLPDEQARLVEAELLARRKAERTANVHFLDHVPPL